MKNFCLNKRILYVSLCVVFIFLLQKELYIASCIFLKGWVEILLRICPHVRILYAILGGRQLVL